MIRYKKGGRMQVRMFFAAVALAIVETAIADVAIETSAFKLVIGDDATAKSLVVKSNGEEM